MYCPELILSLLPATLWIMLILPLRVTTTSFSLVEQILSATSDKSKQPHGTSFEGVVLCLLVCLALAILVDVSR